MRIDNAQNFGRVPSRTDITTFGEGEKFRMASNSGIGRDSSPGHVLHLFLLALHTNLAAGVAK